MTRGPARSHYASKAAIVRLVAAARAAGLDEIALELDPDGTVRLLPATRAAPDRAAEVDTWADLCSPA